jgi:ubiquinone/menaquinone biosynthesis C-methylase UbiE
MIVTEDPSDFFEGTEMPTTGWWEALWPDPASVIAAVGMKPGMDVVDLCSGDGWFTLPIAKLARHVVAIDIDPPLLEISRQRLTEAGASNCEFVLGNAYDLIELVPGKVDFVFMANAFHGVPDKPRLARTVSGMLRTAGRFAVVNWHQRARESTTVLGEPRGPKTELRLSPEQTIDSVEAGGLKLAAHLEVPPYHYAAVFERPAI